MADTRGLAVNRDIYNFETMMYRVYDNIPAKHKHTLSALALQSTLDMRHYSNLGCKMYKGCISEKARLNSYLGLLRWSHSYNLRKAQMMRLQASKWAQIFRFPVGYEKVEIKASKSKIEHYRRLNRVRHKQQLSISIAL